MSAESTGIVSSRLLVKGRKYDVVSLRLRHRDGTTEDRAIVRHPGACVIVPVLDHAPDPRLVMIRNRRVAIGQTLLEFPAGTREASEPPEACARRELAEETGYACRELILLGWFYTTPGMTDERMWAFAARGLEASDAVPEPDEELGVEVQTLSRARALLDSGELHDGKSIAALVLAIRRGVFGGVGRGPDGV